MSTKKIKRYLTYAAKLLVGILVVSPIVYACFVSFMDPSEVSSYPPKVIPDVFKLVNYRTVLNQFPLFTFLKNSLIVCAVIILSQVIVSSFSAYAFAFFDFPCKELLFTLIISTMMIPAETIIISNYLTMCDLGLVNTYLALVLPYLASGMGIFLMRQFYLTIPSELKQAASIDGCGDFMFLFRITMPLSAPTIASLGVYVFVITYNQYMWPLFVTNSTSMRTVQIGMSMLIEAETVNYGNVTAGAVFILVPIVLIFVLGQKYLVKGMIGGAVKG